MLGRFGYKADCSLIHYMPQGMFEDGLPVIVFPKDPSKVVEGCLYDFLPKMTARATYTIDGKDYRVAHAICMHDATGQEASLLDTFMHSKSRPQNCLGDMLSPEIRAKLEALRGA